MNTAEKRATAALWSIRGVGPVTLREVRERVGPVAELLEKPTAAWAPLVPWRADAGEHVSQLETLAARADQLEGLCARAGMEIVFPDDPAWPSRLDGIPTCPPLLFMRGPGARAPRRRRLAIVGSRNPDGPSAQRAHRLASELAGYGVGVVSGAAVGIDQAAHFGALEGGGETWAFMGSALDEIDSGQHAVSRAMLDAGQTLFSEFPPGFRANTNSFTLRNRLISGASDAVLVFRAGPRSGALHTAEDARQQGRPLLAAPGDPWLTTAKGANALIQKGAARLYLETSDLLAALGVTGSLSPPEAREVDESLLSPRARSVLDLLERGSCDFEGMLSALPEVSSGQLTAALLELEVHGAVLHRGGRRYEKR